MAAIFLGFLTIELQAQVNITTWKATQDHAGNNSQETILTPANVSASGSFGLLFSQQVQGEVYAQPLYVSGLKMSNGTIHNVVFVATQHDCVYAFDADNNTGNNASPLWSDTFIPTGTTTVPAADTGADDIEPEIGITATPVIDTTTNTLYVVTKVKKTSDTSYHQYLHALDITSGTEKFGGPVEISQTFAGGGVFDTIVNGTFQFSALHYHARGALVLYNGLVYITYASHGDYLPYHGCILAYNATTLQPVKYFDATANGAQAGIWQAGAGPAIDGSGNMYFMTGNGAYDQATSSHDTDTDWGESAIKLPTTGTFDVSYSNTMNWFTPNNYNTLNQDDADLGSGGPLLLPDQTGGSHPHLLIGGGKQGILYLLDRDNLSGLHSPDQAVQEIDTGHAIFSTPSYFNGNIYFVCANSDLEQLAVGYNATTGNYIATSGNISSPPYPYNGSIGATTFISSNGTSNGVVWVTEAADLPSKMDVYNATNVSGAPIYTYVTSVPGSGVGCQVAQFFIPTVVNGKVYLSGYTTSSSPPTGYLYVLGLLTGATTAPNAPSNLTATPSSSSTVTLNWIDNSSNESGFKVYRATQAAGPYTQISLTGANITTYSDSGLSPQTTYYYQVASTNNVGTSTVSNTASATTFSPYTPTGLVAYWTFDEGSGTTAHDVTGNGHDGTLIGEINWSAGYIGNAVSCHGIGNASSNVTVPDAASLEFSATQSFTLSAWVDAGAFRGVDEAVIAKSRETGNYYGIWINSSQQWVFRGPGGDLVGPTATTAWTHVAVVQNGSANTRQIYINGSLAATGTAQAANGTGNLLIGQANGVTNPFPGIIDEVRLYNRALAASEISNLMGPPVLNTLSRQTHGASGTFDLVFPTNSTVSIEPREGSPQGSYNLILTFSSPVSGITATLGLQSGQTGSVIGAASNVSYDTTGKIVTVTLTGVGNAQRLNLHLSGIQPGYGTADIPVNILWGDLNQNGLVSSSDVNIEKSVSGSAINSQNFLDDINENGLISSSDVNIVKSLSGTALP